MINGQTPLTEPNGTTSPNGHSGNGYARITPISLESGSGGSSGGGSSGGGTLPATQYVTEADGWEHLGGDTWRYVFHVFNDEALFTLRELIETVPGYTCDMDVIQLDGSVQKSAVFVNRKPDLYGDLTVTKTVQGIENSTQRFTYTLTLEGHTGTEIIDGIVFEDGVTTFTLADGESLTVHGLPKDTAWTVTETANPSFTANELEKTGTIPGGGVAEANFVNVYTPPEYDPVDVILEKLVTGAVDPSDASIRYPFSVMLSGLEKELEYVVQKGDGTELMRFTSSASGAASFTLTLGANERAVLKNLPVGSHYRFVENAGDWTASFRITDAGSGTGREIIQTTGENTGTQQSLSTAEEKVEDGEAVTVSYTNRLSGVQSLRVEKQVVKTQPLPDDDGFDVTVHFYGLESGYVINSSIGRWIADDMGEVFKTFTLRSGQGVNFTNVPVGAQYEVTEAAYAKYVASYAITVPEDQTGVFVSQNGANTQANQTLSTEREMVNRYEDATVTLTNTQALGSVTVTKAVTGNMSNREKAFTFTFTTPRMGGMTVTLSIDGGEPEEVTLSAAGSLSFTLRHGQTATIAGLPVGESYTVTETPDFYTASYRIGSGAVQSSASATGTVPASGVTVAYTNDLNVTIPTGIGLDLLGGSFLLLTAVAGLLVLSASKRRKRRAHGR